MQYRNASQLLIYTPRKIQGNPARNNIANSELTIKQKSTQMGVFDWIPGLVCGAARTYASPGWSQCCRGSWKLPASV